MMIADILITKIQDLNVSMASPEEAEKVEHHISAAFDAGVQAGRPV